MRPRLTQIQGNDNSRSQWRCGGTMRRQNDVVLNNHVPRFDLRVEQHGVSLGIGYARNNARLRLSVSRGATENPSVMRLGAVGVTNPVELPVNKVDAARFVPRVQTFRHDNLPTPRVLLGVIGASQPVALVPSISITVAGTGIERVFGRIIRHGVNVAAQDGVVGVAQQRACRASTRRTVIPKIGILSEGIRDLYGVPVVG